MRTCTAPSCTHPVRCKGLCAYHYNKSRRSAINCGPHLRSKIPERAAKIAILQRRRLQLGLSRTYVAVCIGVSQSSLHKYENTDTFFGERILAAYESALRNYVAKVQRLAAEWGY